MVRYFELFGPPLSGKSTLVKRIEKESNYKTYMAATNLDLYRFICLTYFICCNPTLIKYFFKLPITWWNIAASFRRFYSFTARYRDAVNCSKVSNNVVLDEGLAQAIWGLLTYYDYENYKSELPVLVEQFCNLFDDVPGCMVVKMSALSHSELLIRSRNRKHHHGYISAVLLGKTEKIDKYIYCYNLLLLKLENDDRLLDHSEFDHYL